MEQVRLALEQGRLAKKDWRESWERPRGMIGLETYLSNGKSADSLSRHVWSGGPSFSTRWERYYVGKV